jgi:lipoprotein-anchoring transpeptidase ErfK/SrfK
MTTAKVTIAKMTMARITMAKMTMARMTTNVRFLANTAAALGMVGMTTVVALANPYDADGRYGFGPPFGRSFSTPYGGSAGRGTVSYPGNQNPGTIVINTRERRLYLVLGGGQALAYPIGVGRVGFTWSGTTRISAKREWPGWTPPAQMRQRRPDLPRHMPGGIDNPLGARAMYLGSSLYRIHGSNEPETIGQAVSSGCFRLTNEDVVDLYNRVSVGARVIVQQ